MVTLPGMEGGIIKQRTPSPVRTLKRVRYLDDEQERALSGVSSVLGARMDLTYVTERIIALTCPGEVAESEYRAQLSEMCAMLSSKHKERALVVNVSETALSSSGSLRVDELGWPESLAPPLERLCTLCRVIDRWLLQHPQNVLVLHCHGSLGKLSVAISAFLHYTSICASPDQALDRFIMRQFLDERAREWSTPSQRRYIEYFEGLLSGKLQSDARPLYLHAVKLHAVSMERVQLKVYQSLQLVFHSPAFQASSPLVVPVHPPVQLRGDVLVKAVQDRRTLFRVQLHTCALDGSIVLPADSLDESCLPAGARLELVLTRSPQSTDSTQLASPVAEQLPRWDSYETLAGEHHANDNTDWKQLRADMVSQSKSTSSSSSTRVATSTVSMSSVVLPVSGVPAPWPVVPPPSLSSPTVSSVHVNGLPVRSALLVNPAPSSLPLSEPVPLRGSMDRTQSPGRKSQTALSSAALDALLEELLRQVEGPRQRTLASPRQRAAIHRTTDESFYVSDSEVDSVAWLERQKRKLAQRRATETDNDTDDDAAPEPRRLLPGRSRHNKMLAEQLREEDKTAATGKDFDIDWNLHPTVQEDIRSTLRMSSPRRLLDSFPSLSEPDSPVRAPIVASRQQSGNSEDRSRPVRADERRTETRTADENGVFSERTSEKQTVTVSSSAMMDVTNTRRQPSHASSNSDGDVERRLAELENELNTRNSPETDKGSRMLRGRNRSFDYEDALLQADSEEARRKLSTMQRIEKIGIKIIPDMRPHDIITSPVLTRRTSREETALKRTHADQRKVVFEEDPTVEDTSPSLKRLHLEQRRALFAQHEPVLTDKDAAKDSIENGRQLSLDEDENVVSASALRSRRDVFTPDRELASDSHTDDDERPLELRDYLSMRENGNATDDVSTSPGPVYATIKDGRDDARSPSVYSRRSSVSSQEAGDVLRHPAIFVRNTSRFWYKPKMSREEAITLLQTREPGAFIVRDSNSYPGAFGLALKVAQPPQGANGKPAGEAGSELVRHFLIEPTNKGVRLKGCPNEPVFGSLAALVYQHSITPLALPSKLVLPTTDPSEAASSKALLDQGAACHVLYLGCADTESLTGPQAVARTLSMLLGPPAPEAQRVHFKVTSSGITLTDVERRLFFRRHFPIEAVTYAGIDPRDRTFLRQDEQGNTGHARCFGFVARKTRTPADNECMIFAELEQPAGAVVAFLSKVMLGPELAQQH